MEQQSFSDSNVYMRAYAKALWQSIKKKQRNITIIALVLMFIVELFVASFRGFGSPTGHVGNYSVIESIYPIMVIACCLVASFGMSSKNQISAKRLSAFKEWLVRFGIFVVLPTLFFFFCGHLIDLLVASPSWQPAPWEIGFYPLQGGYTVPIIFFLISFFFLVSTFLAKYSFVFGSVILLFFYITVPAILPKEKFWHSGWYEVSPPVIAFIIAMTVVSIVLSYIILWYNRKSETAKEVQ